MIRLTKELPDCSDIISAEQIKIYSTFDNYSDIALFWVQNDNDCVISMLDNNMVILNNSADIDELSEFIKMICPSSIFSDFKTLELIGLKYIKKVSVYSAFKDCFDKENIKGDSLKSKEIYDIFKSSGLTLPEYEYFAVDYCLRLNHKKAEYFGIKDTCAAVSFSFGDKFILNGIASTKKGYGSVALSGILRKNAGKRAIVCCEDSVKEFYEKNGFEFMYKAGIWMC